MRAWVVIATTAAGCVIVPVGPPPPPRPLPAPPLAPALRSAPAPAPAPAPLAIAEPTPACPQSSAPREILAATKFPNAARIFASARGFDLFWSEGDGGTYWLNHRALSLAGEPVGADERVLDWLPTGIARGDDDTYVAIWVERIAAFRLGAAKPLWETKLSGGQYLRTAIVWDPDHAQWVVGGEQVVASADRNHDLSRLVVARLDRNGTWVSQPTFISPAGVHAQISDWGNPLVAADHRVAVLWEQSSLGDSARSLHVTELQARGSHDIVVAHGSAVMFRSTLAVTRDGYAIAGSTFPKDLRDSRVFATTVRAGAAAPLRIISDPDRYGGEVVIAGSAIAWDEQDPAYTTTAHAGILSDGRVSATFAGSSDRGSTDFTLALVPGPCGVSLLYTKGINPSALWLVRVGPT